MIEIFNIMQSVLISLFLVYKLKKLEYKIFFNIKYFVLTYSFLYTLLPVCLLRITNKVQNWGFSEDTIFLSNLYSAYFNIVLLIFCIIIKDRKYEPNLKIIPNKYSVKISKIVFVFSTVLMLFLIIKIYPSFVELRYSRVDAGKFFSIIESSFKLKGLLFLNLCTSSILYWKNRTKKSFIPLLLISTIDIFAGGRSYLFLALIFIYINICIKNRKIYFTRIFIILTTVLSYATFLRLEQQSRMIGVRKEVEFIYQSLGEFVQTYNTFPYIIQNKISSSNIIGEILVNFFSGILPGFIKSRILLDYSIGELIAKNIDRGYGLGLDILTESYYYFQDFGILTLPFIIIIFSEKLNKIAIKLNFTGYLFLVLFICYLRLIFREGIVTYITIVFYIYMIYFNINILNIKKIFLIGERSEKNKIMGKKK